MYPPLQLREELRINNPSEAGPRTNIVGAAVDRDSALYIMEASRNEILVFDSAGHFMRKIGERGESPGQFLSLGSIGIIGDTVWVSDPRQGRVTLFSRAGKVLRTFDNSEELPGVGAGRYSLLGILPDGSRLVGAGSATMAPGEEDRSIPLMRITPAGKVDTLFDLPIPGTFSIVSGGNTRFVMRPFDERPAIGVRHDGMAWVEVTRAAGKSGPAFATVTRFSVENGKEWSTKVPLTPVPISRGVTDSIVNSAPVSEDKRDAFRKWLNVPKRMPLVISAMLSGDGTIWLQESAQSDSSRWVRLDAKGAPNGQLVLPNDALILFAAQSRMWIMRKSEMMTTVLKFRILG
jgi:hypothetical protein